MKNIPKIESNIIIGYSNFANFLSTIKCFDELSTNKLEVSMNILKKFEKASLVKLSKNIFSTLFEPFKIIAIVSKIIEDHDGELTLRNNQNGGAVVQLVMTNTLEDC